MRKWATFVQANDSLHQRHEGAFPPCRAAVDYEEALGRIVAQQHRAEKPLQKVDILIRQRGFEQFVEESRTFGVGPVIDRTHAARQVSWDQMAGERPA